ncbi:MAG: hypothetical protein E7415_02175 [Ruminococcaceae bacterium]|nr:hypothetical protein [Oscillospiraceae bacterium]
MTIEEALKIGGKIPNWIDSLSIGGQVTVIGLIIVFTVLVILMFVLKIMEKIFAPKTAKNQNETPEIVAPVVEEKKVEQKPVTVVEEDDEEIIAVIMAAIAASLNTSTYNLKIKSFRRVSNTAPAWNKAGLNETINSRF